VHALLVRSAIAVAVMVPGLVAGAGSATAAPADYAIPWTGSVNARTLRVPGPAGGFEDHIVASYRLWIPSGGTWHTESAVTGTGVRRATAPGSPYGRVSFGHVLECGPDRRNSAGRLVSPTGLSTSGGNLLYDQHKTTTTRMLWAAARGYNRCQVIISLGRDDLAVAGKTIHLDSGYVRLVGRGLNDPGSQTLYGLPQTATKGLTTPRFLSRVTPTLTSPNFEIAGYVAPPELAVAGASTQHPAVTGLDVVGDAYVTTCYAPTSQTADVAPFRPPPCPRFDGTFLTAATYSSRVYVLQYNADGTLCQQTQSAATVLRTTGYVHHQQVRTRVAVRIDPSCTSRTFRAKLYVRWVSGNAFWVEGRPELTHISIRPVA
jgi:hypothetical protein